MVELSEEFEDLAQASDDIAGRLERYKDAVQAVEAAVNDASKAWSGSWLGYHACVYYDRLQSPPPGARFSSTYGFMDRMTNSTIGDWVEYPFDELSKVLKAAAGKGVFTRLKKLAKAASEEVAEQREGLLSALNAITEGSEDNYLKRLLNDAENAKISTPAQLVEYVKPSGKFQSADEAAISRGFCTPPHIAVLCELHALESPFTTAKSIANIARRAVKHLSNRKTAMSRKPLGGENVFIGHGGSPIWKDLKDFIKDRLDLSWDEFNRVPIAGVTNVARLSQMLDSAAVAFLVMTAEDEQQDSTYHARMNVIHEAGLFQGRLGFERAIVLLEEGCEEFSNIQGLGQIRFPSGNISAVFENIRQVLEREGLLE